LLTQSVRIARDQFYMQFFMSAFPDSDFSQLVETEDDDEMAANI